MIMRGVVQGVAPSMEEAAQTLRANRRQTFFTVTLPLLKPGLANAFLVGFIESIADFGNPVVVGGQFSVLATDIFFAIVGAQYDQGRAASLAWILTVFALVVFFMQRALLGKQNYTTVSGKGDAGIPMALPEGVRRLLNFVVYPWLAFTVVVYLFAFAGGFVQTWGRDYTLTLAHFKTAFGLEWGQFGLVWAGTAWNSLFTTVKLAGLSAPMTAAVGLLIAYLLARTEFRGQGWFEFVALLAFAIPGTVLGVSYILAFNVPPVELTGTGLIIVLCFMFRNLPVGVRAGTAAFKQLDKSLDEASLMLRASTFQTLRHVVLPLLKPALVAALVYSFVRAMTTVSAVIFLVTAPLLTHAVRVELPRASSSANMSKPDTIELSIDAASQVYWNKQVVDTSALTMRLNAAAAVQPQPELHIRAERTTPYEKVAQVMSDAARAGVSRIGFVTDPARP